jgi:dTDP-4-amino-4,6-dideoxygalactose transaminase
MTYKYRVRFVNYPEHYQRLKSELDSAYFSIMNSGDFILRQHLEDFEQNFADFLGVKYTVGLNSGTDALFFSVRAAGLSEGYQFIEVKT